MKLHGDKSRLRKLIEAEMEYEVGAGMPFLSDFGTAELTEHRSKDGHPIYLQRAGRGEYYFVLVNAEKIGAMGSLQLCEEYEDKC